MKDAKSNLIFGYNSVYDFLDSNFGLQNTLPHFILSTFFGILGQIFNYQYNNELCIIILGIGLAITSILGIIKSIKNKLFTSDRFPRILIRMLLYTILLGISWEISNVSEYFNWIPGVFFGGFLSISIIGSIKNFSRIFKTNFYEKNKFNK